MDAPRLLGLERERLGGMLEAAGERRYRADQVFSWVHAKGVLDPARMTDLPVRLRARLGRLVDVRVPDVVERREAGDGTVKMVLGLHDGWRVESVLIPRESDEDAAADTLCVSTQVGCAVRCRFCRSGAAGLRRNLDCSEILAQVHAARRLCGPGGLQRVVFMGIGEPLDNFEAVACTVRVLTDEKGLGLSARRIVVSTVGRPRAMRRLGRELDGRVGLAVSLHAADPRVRARLVGRRAAPPAPVLAAARDHPLGRRDRVTVEVVLVGGVNDAPRQAAQLVSALHGLRCRVNLIALNPFPGLDLRAPSRAAVESFAAVLSRAGVPTFVRRRRGEDIGAACGQLAFGGSKEGEPAC